MILVNKFKLNKIIKLKYLFLLLVTIVLTINVFAQDEGKYYKSYTVKDGLSQSTVNCIIQDKKGFMWFGTQDGLNRFDGYTFDNIRIKNNILENIITCMSEDYNGNIWIGTYSGLFFYNIDKERFVHNITDITTECKYAKKADSLLMESWISGIYKDSAYMYVVSNANIIRFDLVKKKSESLIEFKNKKNGVMSFLKVPIAKLNDTIYFGVNNILYKWNVLDKTLTIKENNSKYNDFYFDGSNSHLAGTEKSLIGKENSLLPNTTVYSFKKVKDKVWIGTEDGLYTIDTSFNTSSLKRLNEFPNGKYFDFYIDNSENLWIATYKHGVLKYDLKDKKFKKNYNKLKNIRSVYKSNDTLFIGTEDKGIFIYKGNMQILKSINNIGTTINVITKVNNRICVSACNKNFSNNKIYFLNNNNFEQVEIVGKDSFNIEGNRVYEIFQDTNNYNIVWIGTAEYLYKLKYQKDSSNYFARKIDLKNVSTIINKDKSELIIGSFTGLYTYNYKTDSLKLNTNINNKTTILNITKGKDYWMSSNHGLYRFNNKLEFIKKYTVKDGLFNNFLYDVVYDNKFIWISSNKGIGKLDVIREQFNVYKKNDGIEYPEFNIGASFKDKNGKIYFGGIDGLYSFNPNSIYDYTYQPPVYITKIVTGDSIYKYPDNLTKIILKAEDNFLTIYFSILDFTEPELNKYEYQLIGYDDLKRITTGKEPKAVYKKLESGEYILEVKGANNDGYWSDKNFKIRIKKEAYWYKWLIIIGVIIFLILIILLILLWLNNKKKKIKNIEAKRQQLILVHKEEELEYKLEEEKRKVEIAHKELVNQKTKSARAEFIASITHEINTPIGITVTNLTTLDNESKKLNNLFDKDKLDEHSFINYINDTLKNTDLALRNISRASRLINSLREISRDQITNYEREIELVKYLENLIETLKPEWKNNNLEINVIYDRGSLKIYTIPGVISQVFTNLIVNSVRHGFNDFNNRRGGKIDIIIKRVGKKIFITYQDNGDGIRQKYISEIFNPYFSTNEDLGSGLGMFIVKKILNNINGTIKYNREHRGEGARFDIIFEVK